MTTRRPGSLVPALAGRPGHAASRRPLLPLAEAGDLLLRALVYALSMLGLLHLLGLVEAR